MLTVNGTIYKDVDHKDFYHYFQDTAMMWKITPTKTRLFIVGENVDNEFISGSYLTRESMFKNKRIAWEEWWRVLDPIVLEPLLFNVTGGCGLWKHPLAKNLRKSFPWKTGGIKFYGAVKAEDRTMQKIGSIAFGELYGRPKYYPSLLEGLQLEQSVACDKRYIIDRQSKQLLLLGRHIGQVSGTTVSLHNHCAVFKKKFIKEHTIPESWIKIQDPPLKPPPPKVVDMADVPIWLNGYHPEGIVVGYAVMNEAGTIRTYSGIRGKLMPGWGLYNSWGQP